MARDVSSGRLTCLDGLRGMAILLAIVAHLTQSLVAAGAARKRGPVTVVYEHYGGLGVTLFFVLSGYLITRLLVRERALHGSISLRHFYLRRALRILPPLGLLLFVLGVGTALGMISLPRRGFVAAGLFLSNFRLVGTSGHAPFLGHTWSLAIEEQFYLFWPALLVFVGARRTRRFAAALIAAMPLIRIAFYFLFPATRFMIETRPEGCADRLMFGSLLALAEVTPALEGLLRRALRSPLVPLLAAIHFLLLSPVLTARFGGLYRLPIGISSEGLAAAVVIAWVLRHPDSRLTTGLQSSALVTLGTLSYSLYLWQQPFLNIANRGTTGHFPLNLLLCFAAATASYQIVARPLMSQRRIYSGVIAPARPVPGDALPGTAGRLPVPGSVIVPGYGAGRAAAESPGDQQ